MRNIMTSVPDAPLNINYMWNFNSCSASHLHSDEDKSLVDHWLHICVELFKTFSRDHQSPLMCSSYPVRGPLLVSLKSHHVRAVLSDPRRQIRPCFLRRIILRQGRKKSVDHERRWVWGRGSDKTDLLTEWWWWWWRLSH